MSVVLRDSRNVGLKLPLAEETHNQSGPVIEPTEDFGVGALRVNGDSRRAQFRTTDCACASLRRASRAISHLYDQVLVPTQLKATQYIILRTVDERGEIAHCDLARELAASVETLSRRLAAARKAGLVQVHNGEQNRRIYRLTPRGKLALERATRYWQNAQRRLQHNLGEKDWEMLAEFSDRLVAAAMRAESMALANGDTAFPVRSLPGRDNKAADKLL